jgi:hypothetical protein
MAKPICRDCGHGQHAHEHYSSSIHCAKCDCSHFHRRHFWHSTTYAPITAKAEILKFPDTTGQVTWTMSYMSWVVNLPERKVKRARL